MTVGATAQRKNIASPRGGGQGSPKPSAPGSSGIRIKLSDIPGVFDGFREGSGDEKTGKLVEITIIKAGVSLNGLDYLPATLKEAAPLFAGVPIYSFKFGNSPDDESKERHLPEQAKTNSGTVGNMVAQIKEAWWDETAMAIRGLVAVFDDSTRTRLKNAFDQKLIGRGVKQPAFGLSIDAAGLKEDGGVTKIVRPESVDMVKKPAAGGGFDRLVASAPEEDEDEMKPEEVTKLIEETVGKTVGSAVLKALKEQEEAGPGAAPGDVDALSGLRKMMEGMGPEDRRSMATRVLAMFREMGLAEASPEQARASAMHEAMKSLCESEKDAGKLKEGLAKLVEDHAAEPKDANLVKLEEAEKQLRRMAIQSALDTFKLEDGGSFHDARDAMRLADLSAVQVAEDYSEVTGLAESLTALSKAKPYLVKAKEAAGDDPNAKPGESDEDKKKRLKEEADAKTGDKPPPRGQSIHLQEDLDEEVGLGVDVLQKELDGIDEMLKSGSGTDRDLARRAKVGSALKRARTLA